MRTPGPSCDGAGIISNDMKNQKQIVKALNRANEVLAYCKLWTKSDLDLPHLPLEKRAAEHRIAVIEDALNQVRAALNSDGKTP